MIEMDVNIRLYQPGDESQIKTIVNQSVFVTVNKFFMEAVTKEITAQFLLMFSAVLFIVLEFPLYYSALAVPVNFTFIYAVIYIGHWIKTIKTHRDLSNISSVYDPNARKAFFVAELKGKIPAQKITEKTNFHINFTTSSDNVSSSSLIIGTVAIDIKDDPDMKDPPETVAWLRRMAVVPQYRKMGIGSKLLDVALDYCNKQDFKAIELITTQCHDSARSLYMKKGFEMIHTFTKDLIGGYYVIGMYRLRLLCKRSLLNA